MSDRAPSECPLRSWMLRNIHEQKWGSPSSILSYKHLKLNLRVFFAGHIVAIVTIEPFISNLLCHENITNVFTHDWAVF